MFYISLYWSCFTYVAPNLEGQPFEFNLLLGAYNLLIYELDM